MRSTPKVTGSNRITVLPQGQEVKKIDDTNNPWWLIRTSLLGDKLEGYVNSRYLVKDSEFDEPVKSNSITAIHLTENKTSITRNRDGGRAYPLGESNRPIRTATDTKDKIEQLKEIINWINVDLSIRYFRKGSTTYCNIYAYDYCYLSGVYIPRVWWTQKSIIELSKGNEVSVLYGDTVTELNANSLHNWLSDFGADFEWMRIFSVDEAQLAANNGKVVVVCAKRVTTNRPGHICAIVSETDSFKAKRKSDGSISAPLQSQAGSNNYKYKAVNQWWTSSRFQSFGIWVHE
jgi:hypothetical protein